MILWPDRWEGIVLSAAIVLFSSAAVIGRFASALGVLGAAAGLAASISTLAIGTPVRLIESASGVMDARVAFEVDALSAAFLVPLFVVAGCGAVYAHGYARGRRLALSHGLLIVAMVLVLCARDGISFLVVWEVMAISAFVAATADDRGPEVRAAGLSYLIATHTGTLALIGMVVLLRGRVGSFAWGGAIAADSAVFVLALIGFGLKAGIVPLHFWLPAAHANAPSHVSATMSAVMLKCGIYGVLRITSMFDAAPAWWGVSVLLLGAASAVIGIALASGQTDIKRVLAYSSVENIGIVCVAIGLALLGRALDRADWVAIGIAAAVLHVWNHALFKSLLFFGAGAILHATGERDMEKLGGLARAMPRTARAMTLGAIAAAGLPPLNGFAGEWVLYIGLLSAWTSGLDVALPSAIATLALATVGALAVAAFARLIGITLLGAPRAEREGHDPAPAMMRPIAALAIACVGVTIATPLIIEWTAPAASAWAGVSRGASVATLTALPTAWVGVATLALVVLIAVGMLRLPRRAAPAGTWDCGYAAPSARMQYTGRSFGEWIAERLVPGWLRPRAEMAAPEGLFAREARYRADAPDPFLARVYAPLLSAIAARLSRARSLQQGRLHVYLLYTLITLVALLIWAVLPFSVAP